MKNAAILSLACLLALCVSFALLGRRGEVSATQPAPQLEKREPPEGEEMFAASRPEPEAREEVAPFVTESAQAAEAEAVRRDEEKKPGMLRGHIVDGNGNRVPVGRVLVFRTDRDPEPLAQMDIDGAEREYGFTLPSGMTYYVGLDPASVERFGAPPVSRGLARVQRAPDGSIPLDQYTRWCVRIPEGETVWQDLFIARLGEVTGRLLDNLGRPLPGIVSRIVGMESVNSGHSQDDLTDEYGVFRQTDLFPGSHRLRFFSPDASDFQRPLPTDVRLADGELLDVGDIRIEGGTCTVVGTLVDQDGQPFAGLSIVYYPGPSGEEHGNDPGLADAIQRTKSGADGTFELRGLTTGAGKISLTSGYEPGKVLEGQPAFWEAPLEVFLTRNQPVTDIGVHVVQQSRPFRLEGNLLEALPGSCKGRLRATVTQVGPLLPDVRRASLQGKPVTMDWEAGTFACLVETPRPEIEVRFELRGHEDLVFLLQPEPWGVWTHDIRVPLDFTPRKKSSDG